MSATQTRVAPARIAVEYSAQRLRIPPRRFLAHVHHRQPLADAERDCVLGELQELIERPPFGVPPQGARPYEGAHLDRHAYALGNLRDRRDVGHDRPGGAVRPHVQPLIDDLPREPLNVAGDMRSGAREADVGRVDAEPIDQMQDPDLLVDRRRSHGWRLQSVAQRFIVEQHDPGLWRVGLIPIEH